MAEAKEAANQQLQELLADDGQSIPKHFKAVGFVNGLEYFRGIIDSKIVEYQEKAKEQREQAERLESAAQS